MQKKISLSVFIFVLLAAILLAFMGAYAVSASMFRQQLVAVEQAYAKTDNSKLNKLLEIISGAGLFSVEDDADFSGLLDWYSSVSGDRYAYYYSAEQFDALNSDNAGSGVGIGVMVIENADENAIEITNVMPESAAIDAGLLPGDLIVAVIDRSSGSEVRTSVSELGFEGALQRLRGEEGTYAEFVVKRTDGEHIFSIPRRAYESLSVTYHVNTENSKVGVIKLIEFDLTTPHQFQNAMDELISAGCEYFVFDVRYNPGGDLASISAVLSYMLNDGDIIIRTSGKDMSDMTTTKVSIVNYDQSSPYAACNVKKADIGKYRNAVNGKCAVIANGSTASAAELFTSALKDYGIAKVVGTTTFGKGSMQSVYDLSAFGYDGGLKLTTRFYYPPLSDGYDGIGIMPDVTVELDSALSGKNIYKITDAEDNQMNAALSAIIGG